MSVSNEYGGCLPLEPLKNRNNPFFNSPKIELNSGRSCILKALELNNIRKIWLPRYLCPTVKNFLQEYGMEVKEYNIDKQFIPIDLHYSADAMLLWTRYYGCISHSALDKIREVWPDGQIIIDNTQAFFEKPIITAYNIYSIKKFVGVPGGGVFST